MNKIKNITLTILSALGIVYLFNLYRQFKGEDVDDADIKPILDRIKEGEDKLKEIEESDPEIEEMFEKWND